MWKRESSFLRNILMGFTQKFRMIDVRKVSVPLSENSVIVTVILLY